MHALQKMAVEKAKAGGGMRPSERRAQQMQQEGGYGGQPTGAAPYEGRGAGRGGYQEYGNTRARPEPAGQYGYGLHSPVRLSCVRADSIVLSFLLLVAHSL